MNIDEIKIFDKIQKNIKFKQFIPLAFLSGVSTKIHIPSLQYVKSI